MTIFVPVFLLFFMATLGLVLLSGFLLIVRRRVEALRSLKVLGLMIGIYGLVLAGTGLLSQKSTLPLGTPKCFDDWCFAVKAVDRSPTSITLHISTINRGLRAQAPDFPHAFVITGGKQVEINCPRLGERIERHSDNPFAITLDEPEESRNTEFLVTEGGGPSVVIIGDENSPFHAKSVWQLSP